MLRQCYRGYSSAAHSIKKVTVYGSGLMGAGIAQVAAAAKYKVAMVDLSPTALSKGEKIIATSLGRIAKKKFAGDEAAGKAYVDDILSRIEATTQADKAASDSDLVIEAIVENLELKHKLFTSVDKVAPKHAILASNTSSLAIGDISKVVPHRASHFAGLHFFNPVPQMKLVEIVRGAGTQESVVEDLVTFCKNLGKAPVLCKDTPGFIVNRLLVPYMMEAIRLVERGEATKEDVDTAMKLGAGYPMGPFELMDYVGLDTLKFITEGWYKNGKGLKGDKLVAPSTSLETLVSAGKLGRKNGQGFYKYEK